MKTAGKLQRLRPKMGKTSQNRIMELCVVSYQPHKVLYLK